MSKHYSELIKAKLEQVTGAQAQSEKGLISFENVTNRPMIDDGTDVTQFMIEKHLPEARRAAKVELDDTGAGNEINGTLPVAKGGTNQTTLAGQGVLYSNSAGDTVENETDFTYDGTRLKLGAGSYTGQMLTVNGGAYIDGTLTANSNIVAESIVTNSTIVGSIPFPPMTELQRDAVALTPAEGTGVYNTDTKRLNTYDSSAAKWLEVGSGTGGGGLDVFHSETFETNKAADFTKGNNPTFLGAGAVIGAVTDETVSPIAGDSSLLYTSALTNADDYVASPVIDLDDKQKGQFVGFVVNYKYPTSSSLIPTAILIVYDVTNGNVISDSTDILEYTSTIKRFSTSIFIPDTCNQIRWGYQIFDEDPATLVVDDVELSTNPFVSKDLLEQDFFVEKFQASSTSSAGDLTNLTVTGLVIGKEYIISGQVSMDSFSATANRVRFWSGSSASGTQYGVHLLGNGNSVSTDASGGINVRFTAISNTLYFNKTGPNALKGDGTTDATFVQVSLVRGASEHIVTPAKATKEIVSYVGFTSFSGASEVKFKTLERDTSNLLITHDNTGTHTIITALKPCYITASANLESAGHHNSTLTVRNSGGTTIKMAYLDIDGSPLFFGTSLSLVHLLNVGDYLTVTGNTAPQDFPSTNFTVTATPAEATFLAAVPFDRYAKKTLTTGSISALGTTIIGPLQFNNLVIGGWYRVHTHAEGVLLNSADRDLRFYAYHNGVSMANVQVATDNSPNAIPFALSSEQTFKATASTLTFKTTQAGSAASTLYGGSGETFVELTELAYTKETTRFN